MTPRSIVLLICCLLLVTPVFAIDTLSQAQSVSSYSIVAEPGYVIYQILVDPVPMGVNQTHTLNYNGANFLLTIGSAQSYAIFHDFDISLTFPNGTAVVNHARFTGVSSGAYKLDIQPVFYRAQSANPTFAVSVEVGLNPLMTEFNTLSSDWDPLSSNYAASVSAIPFSAASGNLGATTNVFVYQTTLKEFQENVVHYNPAYGISSLGSVVWQWTWSAVLGFLNMIPIIGPMMASLLTISSVVLPELFFWLVWIVENFLAILLSIETLILLIAVINAGKGKRSFGRLLRNIYQYNVDTLSGILTFIERIRDWITKLIEVITAIIEALKPV